jgi:hypothetical protein
LAKRTACASNDHWGELETISAREIMVVDGETAQHRTAAENRLLYGGGSLSKRSRHCRFSCPIGNIFSAAMRVSTLAVIQYARARHVLRVSHHIHAQRRAQMIADMRRSSDDLSGCADAAYRNGLLVGAMQLCDSW